MRIVTVLALLIAPGLARAAVSDELGKARAALVSGDGKAAAQALDSAEDEAVDEAAVLPASLLARLYFYRGVSEHIQGDKKGRALDAWRQALIFDNGFQWDREVLDADDPRALFEALRAEVRSRSRVDTWVPEAVGAAKLFVDGQRRSHGDEVRQGIHLAQIECPDGSVHGKWTDLTKDPKWFKLCPAGVDTSVVVEEAAASSEDEFADFAPMFGPAPDDGGASGSDVAELPGADAGDGDAAAQAAAAEAARQQAEAEEAARKKAEAEEAARKKAEAEEAARQQAEAEEAARKKAEAEEAARQQAEAEAAAAAEAARKKAEAEEAAREKAEAEEAARKKAEAEEAARKKAEEEAAAAAAAAEEARQKAEAEEAARKKAEAEAAAAVAEAEALRQKAEAEAAARKKAEEEAAAAAAAAEEARQQAEAEQAARKKAEEEAAAAAAAEEERKKAEEEAARKKAEEEAAVAAAAAEEAARRTAEQEARKAQREAEAAAKRAAQDASSKDDAVADADATDEADRVGGDAPSTLSTSRSRKGLNPTGGILMGGGAALIGGGVGAYYAWFSPNYAALQDAQADSASVDDAEAARLMSVHDTSRVVTIGLYGLGAAAIVGGGVTLFLDDDAALQPWVGPHTLGVKGRF